MTIKKFIDITNDYLQKKSIIYISTGFGGFILGILLFIFFSPNYYANNNQVLFEIKKGENLNQIIQRLHQDEIIPSKFNMRIASVFYDASHQIKAGKYRIPNGLNYFELVKLFLKGTPEESVRVTIPEGIWQFRLAQIFRKEMDLDSARFIELSKNKSFIKSLGLNCSNLEGYMRPETFDFVKTSSVEEVMRKLVSETNKLFTDSVLVQIKKMGYSKHEILTIASIVEAESNIVDEFGTIAGVYYNRLKRGMKLQADPTVQYLKRKSKRRNRILYKDLEIDSPYNTYKYPGMPPGPINNPSKEAILASINPEKHNLYYFVADGKGGHIFAKNYSQHLKNVNNYRVWRRANR
ncbi:MAG: endolytic transglycosylase MltG [Melioribacteraceae bacterium]|nr:endolytic transglycosylase MltG [Melioribacteraceae bacterium]